MEVNGIAPDSFIGLVLISIVIGTFLVTLFTFFANRKDRNKADSNLCQAHTDQITGLEKDVTNLTADIKDGFSDLKTDIGGIHKRIDNLILNDKYAHSGK